MPFEGITTPEKKEALPKTEKFYFNGSLQLESEFEYDEQGRVVAELHDHKKNGRYEEQVVYTYDEAGNVVKEERHFSARSLTRRQKQMVYRRLEAFDYYGDLEEIPPKIMEKIDRLGGVTRIAIRQYGAYDEITEHLFDDKGRKEISEKRREYPDGTEDVVYAVEYEHDEDGNEVSSVQADRDSVRMDNRTYDSEGNVLTQEVSDGGSWGQRRVLLYDRKGLVKQTDLYTLGMEKPYGKIVFEHDAEGRVVKSTREYNGKDIEWYTFAYDEHGNLKEKNWRFKDGYQENQSHSRWERTY
jgi:YD repeat-containing protein